MTETSAGRALDGGNVVVHREPDDLDVRFTKPRPDPGPWRDCERAMAISLNGGREYEMLMPPHAFDDEKAGPQDLYDQVDQPDPRATGPASRTVRLRMSGSCAGWARRPEPAELYAAIRSAEPTSRERSILRMWVTETEWYELVRAWAEQVYTLRQLVTALHRAGVTRFRHSRLINQWAAHPTRPRRLAASRG